MISTRLRLNERVLLVEDGTSTEVRVIGTWAFTGSRPSRRDRVASDPVSDEGASGYLLQPTEGGAFIRAMWADEDLGTLRRIPGGHLRLV